MGRDWRVLTVALTVLGLGSGCMSAARHQESLPSARERALTVGVVQKEIRVGMAQADVAAALGSPNIVTRDAQGKETWVYDRIATEASFSRDAGGTGLILGLVGVYSREAGASSTTQRTLTVIVKFDAAQRVDAVSYRASAF